MMINFILLAYQIKMNLIPKPAIAPLQNPNREVLKFFVINISVISHETAPLAAAK
jgi:hypothetical protein